MNFLSACFLDFSCEPKGGFWITVSNSILLRVFEPFAFKSSWISSNSSISPTAKSKLSMSRSFCVFRAISIDSPSTSTPMEKLEFIKEDPIANIPHPHPMSRTFLPPMSPREPAFHNKSAAIGAGVEYCSSSTFGLGCLGTFSKAISRCFFFDIFIEPQFHYNNI